MEKERFTRAKALLEHLRSRELYLYGAGKRGRVALANLNTLGMGNNVRGFLDDKPQGKEKICGKCIYPVEVVNMLEISNAAFLITTYSVNQMACILMKLGISSENIFFFPELLIDDIDPQIFRINRESIDRVYQMLSDNLSKYIYNALFNIYINGNVGILSRTKGETQYFPIKATEDEIEGFCLSDRERFVDCGAYDGDTIREFIVKTENKYEKIWAFEPDMNNYERLFDYVKEAQDERMKLYRAGVYDQDTVMHFSANRGTSATLNATGEENIEVYKLDTLIDEPITFIKMDIEGSEKEALQGARKLISTYKPKLAICIYHKIEDLWEIPLLIKNINPDYQIYIRNYEDRIDETICYAI